MAMRLSGLMSGMDTESIISQLVEVRKKKVDTVKKTQIKSNWKQEAWKELNTKLKNLQSKHLSNLRFSSAYAKKTTKVSNPNAVSVITGEKAMNGVQSLEINQLAKTGYLTGAELENAEGEKADYTALTKLSELGVTDAGAFNVKSASGNVAVNVNGDTTISDVLTKLKEAGLNASFDTKTQRFFVSAKDSGSKFDFSVTASDANGYKALSALGLQVDLKDDAATMAEYQKMSSYYVDGDKEQTIANMKKLIDTSVDSRTEAYRKQYESVQNNLQSAKDTIKKIEEKYEGKTLESVESYTSAIDEKNKKIDKLKQDRKNDVLTEDDKKAIDKEIKILTDEVNDLTDKKKDAESLKSNQDQIDKLNETAGEIEQYVTITSDTVDGKTTYSAVATDKLINEEKESFYNKASFAAQVLDSYDPDSSAATGATKVSGQDAIITLNGAQFTNNTNSFDVNGLTFTALSETKPGETVTVTTQNDTDGIYDMVKNFLKEYNALINEMDKLYNAEQAKDMDPLLSEEKDAMSETEATEYEKKIKDALLRRDDNLSSISSMLKSAMSSGVEVNGKTMHLYDFGIDTLAYFTAPDNEKNAYHIDGDPDDDSTSGNADKLKGMIASDPDTVIAFFTKLSQNMYSKMNEQSKSVDGIRSFGNFYDDKKMKTEYVNYNTKISELEKKLNDYEDSWYKKFAKMETAMAKMQSKTSALTNLFGG